MLTQAATELRVARIHEMLDSSEQRVLDLAEKVRKWRQEQADRAAAVSVPIAPPVPKQLPSPEVPARASKLRDEVNRLRKQLEASMKEAEAAKDDAKVVCRGRIHSACPLTLLCGAVVDTKSKERASSGGEVEESTANDATRTRSTSSPRDQPSHRFSICRACEARQRKQHAEKASGSFDARTQAIYAAYETWSGGLS